MPLRHSRAWRFEFITWLSHQKTLRETSHTATPNRGTLSSGAWLTMTTRRVFHEKFQKFIYCPTVAQKANSPELASVTYCPVFESRKESSNTPQHGALHHSVRIRINMLALYVIIIKQKFLQTSFQEINAPKNSNNSNHVGPLYFSAGGAVANKIWHHMVIVPMVRDIAGETRWSTSYDCTGLCWSRCVQAIKMHKLFFANISHSAV